MAGRIAAQQLESRLHASGIRAIVTSRAKNPDRLEDKLKKRNDKKAYVSFDDIYDDIVDLSGVRVALYFPAERNEVDKIIYDQFLLLQEPKIFSGTTNPSYKKRFSGYWATHYRVKIKPSFHPDACGALKKRHTVHRAFQRRIDHENPYGFGERKNSRSVYVKCRTTT